MGVFMGKRNILAICMAICVGMMFCITNVKDVDAAGYSRDANGVFTIDGTNVTARLAYKILYIEGSGEIPDYTPATYTSRPWQYLDFDTISIAQGITQIGSYAFADLPKVKNVTIQSNTFIKDSTCFQGMKSDVIFRIRGSVQATKQCGTINYTSLDSICANAPGSIACTFILDSETMAQSFREKAYPYLRYVYSATDKSSKWENREDLTKDYKYSTLCKIAPNSGLDYLANMTAQKRPQGSLYLEAISGLLGEYTYVCSYNMALAKLGTIYYGTDGPKKYILQLSPKEQIPERMYRLIEIGPDGQILYLDDEDNSCETVTFSTSYPTSTYALVYKYNIEMLMKKQDSY